MKSALAAGPAVATLRSHHAFHGASAEATAQSAGREMSFAPRIVIFFEGDPVDWIYRIERGAVMLSKLLPDGRRQVVELLGAGDVFGFSSVPVHGCAAETLTATRCAAFDRTAVEHSPV